MKIKTLLAAMALTALPTLSFAMGCNYGHDKSQQAMSCAEGSAWDAATQTCVPLTTG